MFFFSAVFMVPEPYLRSLPSPSSYRFIICWLLLCQKMVLIPLIPPSQPWVLSYIYKLVVSQRGRCDKKATPMLRKHVEPGCGCWKLIFYLLCCYHGFWHGFRLGQRVLTQAAPQAAQESAQSGDNSQEEAWVQRILSGGHRRSIRWPQPHRGSRFQGWAALHKCRSKRTPRPHFLVILPFPSLEWEIFIIWPTWLGITHVTWISFCWINGSFPVNPTSICNWIDSRNICKRVPGSWGITCGSDALVKMFLRKCFSFDYLWKSLRKTCHAHQWITTFKNSLWLLLQIIFLCQLFIALSVFAHLDWSLD